MKKTILTVVTLFVLLTVFPGCSKTGKKQKELIDFNLGLGLGRNHMLGLIAKEEGFFEEEGLNVTIVPLTGNSQTVVSIESGKLDAAFVGSVPTTTFIAAGHDLTVFGGAMTGGHGYVIKNKYVPAGWKEGDLSILKGLNVANFQLSIMDYEIKYLLNQQGIEVGEGPDKVNIIYFAGANEVYAALLNDEIAAASVVPPFIAIANKDGYTPLFYCKDIDRFRNHPCCRQIALTKDIDANPEIYIALERALIKAYKFSQENHEKTIDDVIVYAPIDKDILEYEIYHGHALSHPDPDKKSTAILKGDVVTFGFTDGADFDIEQHYNIDIYKTALAQLIAKYPNDPVYKEMEAYFNSAN